MPQLLLACAVCFGQSDSPMAIGANMGVLLMLGVTAGVLSAFAGFIIYLIRRAKLVESQQPSAQAIGGSGKAEGYLPTEGTA